MARPSKLTPEVEERILKALRAGNYATAAASYAGIHPATYYRWLERGDPSGRRRADMPYRRFAERVQQASAEAEIRDVTRISKAAETDWRAASWRLSHRHPERWGRRTHDRQDTSQPTKQPDREPPQHLQFALQDMSNEDLNLLARAFGMEKPPIAHHTDERQNEAELWLHLVQAIWDERYRRQVPLCSKDNREWISAALESRRLGKPLDDPEIKALRDEIAGRHGLPPRPH